MTASRSNLFQPSLAGHHPECPADDQCICESLWKRDESIKESQTLEDAYRLYYDADYEPADYEL